MNVRTNGRRGRGVSLYIKQSLSYKVKKIAFHSNDFESFVIELERIVFTSM